MDFFKGLINIFFFAVVFFACFCFWKQCGDEKKQEANRVDTVVMLGIKPITNNYSFTNPTAYKETIIIYDSTKKNLTKEDSDFIVLDYLKRREYMDSIKNDTSKIIYKAIVEKNILKDIEITYSYKPLIYKITETHYKNSMFIGLAPGYYPTKPTAGLYAGFETKQMGFGAIYDPFLKGGSLIISKRINFK